MPTLLSSTSTLPHLARQASTIALTWALLDASHSKAAASPPSLAINPTVSSAAARWRSTQNTWAPSRAKVTAVHLPLPQPGPLEPAPTTIATLSFSRPGISSPPLRLLAQVMRQREADAMAERLHWHARAFLEQQGSLAVVAEHVGIDPTEVIDQAALAMEVDRIAI